jgi:hypothetical protein
MKVIFFSGSSAVGKSEALAKLPENIIRAPLSARDARERLGNPDWKLLRSDREILKNHQTAVLGWFKYQVDLQVGQAAKVDRDSTIIFERCLWDVAGYSYAFGASYQFLADQVEAIREFEYDLMKEVEDQLGKLDTSTFHTVYFPIDTAMTYAEIEARPPEYIRDRQEAWLKLFLYDNSRFTKPVMVKTSKDNILDVLKPVLG